jgi:von Willebrand factor type A domain
LGYKSRLLACMACALWAALGSPTNATQSIALILDASGSMNARLPEGRTRIEAAKAAVEEIVGKLPADVRLSLRAYGHQSPTVKHDCRDTELLVGFDDLASNKATIVANARVIKAQGYTPITYVLKLAAEDVGRESAKPRTVILVSDGKETCEGDPCATAKALAAADASLVIHTIGFSVDTAAKYQLQCIARVARGRYFDADGAGKLASALGEAAKSEAPPPPPPPQRTTQIVVTTPKPGKLAVKNANITGHRVTEAETGKAVGSLSPVQSTIELPAGLYNVAFGKVIWKSVEVRQGETTTLEPGVLEVRNASITGHKVLDAETGEEIGLISLTNSTMTVLPSTFSVTFDKALWKDVEVKSGERKVLNPGVVSVLGADVRGNPIKDEDGTIVAILSPTRSSVPLPPGKYTLELAGQKIPMELSEGQKIDIRAK